MTLRVGSLIFATDSGLGILAKSFVANGIITNPYVVRHGHHHTHEEWYPGAPITANLRADHAKILEFAASMDVMLFLETPFDWTLLPFCKQHGVKTAIIVMYECMPRVIPYHPDLYICPSLLDLQYFPNSEMTQGVPTCADSIYIPVPIDVKWKQRTKAEIFVHNAGHGGLKGRNGTKELLEALRYVKSPVHLILRSQYPIKSEVLTECPVLGSTTATIDYRFGTVNHSWLYEEGDVFIFPEKFNGLSLPLQEARAAGMLCMTGDRFPMNVWLPREPLIPIAGYTTTNVSPRCNDFQSAIIDPKAIAAKIDEWYGADISAYSLQGKQWAEENSWANLKPKYMSVLESLVAS